MSWNRSGNLKKQKAEISTIYARSWGYERCTPAGRDEAMYIRHLANGLTRVHLHDEDDYEITDDNGVNCDLSMKQIERIWEATKPHMREP
jgi:hypothetical protein